MRGPQCPLTKYIDSSFSFGENRANPLQSKQRMNVTRYSEWYDQPANDPYKGKYATTLFRSFDATAAPIDADALLTFVASGLAPNTAFVMLTSEGHIHVVHRIQTCTPLSEEAEAPHHRLVTAMLGDVSVSGPRFVEIPPAAFAVTDEFQNVRTPAAIQAAIQAFPDAHQLAVDPQVRDVTAVRSRFYMLIPPHLTARVLEASMIKGGLTPRDLWIRVAWPLCNNDMLGGDCAPFVDWCRLAYGHGIGRDNPLCQELPPNLLMDSMLYPYRMKILNQDIPYWKDEYQMEGVEHTEGRDGSITALSLSVDIEQKKVFLERQKLFCQHLPTMDT
jgi:hypothetical protein